jgi:Myb-like DNA-binding domain
MIDTGSGANGVQNENADGDPDDPRPGKRGKRSKWSVEETNYLIQGVAHFGIGGWKKILKHPEYKFKEGRNSIDLKDRFRTCFPDEYRKSGSQKGKVESTLDDSGKRRGRGSRTTVELAKMGYSGDIAFPKLERRARKNFTKAEDDALLQGFLKYPAQWKKIQSDPELGLSHRTRTDLRDRFRNRFPQRFKEAGYKHKAKQGGAAGAPSREQEPIQESVREPPPTTLATNRNRQPKYPMPEEMELATLLINHNRGEPTSQSSDPKSDSVYPLPLLNTGITDPYDPEFTQSPNSPDDDGTQLARGALDWAERQRGGAVTGATQTTYEDPTVIPNFNPYHLTPLLAHERLSANASTLPLSRILNAENNDERQSEI